MSAATQQLQEEVKNAWVSYEQARNKLVAACGGLLQQLPHDVLSNVMRFLPENRMFRLRIVCRAFHACCWQVLRDRADAAFGSLCIGDTFQLPWTANKLQTYMVLHQRNGIYVGLRDEQGVTVGRRKVKRSKDYNLYVKDNNYIYRRVPVQVA